MVSKPNESEHDSNCMMFLYTLPKQKPHVDRGEKTHGIIKSGHQHYIGCLSVGFYNMGIIVCHCLSRIRNSKRVM